MQLNSTLAMKNQNEKLKTYYRFHSKIYDLTRWSFLFGRKEFLSHIPLLKEDIKSILEIGCGTGYNLNLLARKYNSAVITGIDISLDMIEKAQKNTSKHNLIDVRQCTISTLVLEHKRYDIILISYVLTLLPDWESYLSTISTMLSPKGVIVVVDFHQSPYSWFKKHMANHNVTMEAHLVPALNKRYTQFGGAIKNAYFGIWQYFIFVGRKK